MMTHYDYLIIGSGIAGVTAAETIREKNSSASIGIVSNEPHLLYSRVLIPSFLKHKISREQLFLRRAEDFTVKSIDLHLGQTVASIDPKFRAVKLESGLTFRFRKLLISSGGRVKSWGKKEDEDVIYRLQTIDDADRLNSALGRLRQPLVIGSSFIALEFLEIFFLNNIAASLLSRDTYFFSKIFDSQGGELMQNNFQRHGIRTIFGDSAQEVRHTEKELSVTTERKEEIKCDALSIGIGLDRNIEFLEGSGIELGEKGVRTDEFLQTNFKDIYAAGDAAEYFDTITGRLGITANWTSAFLQGKCAGLNMVSTPEPFKNVPAYSITNLGFQITAIGECNRELETMVRLDKPNDQYEQLFIREGTVAGAALINRFQDRPHLAKLIETKTPIGPYLDKLQSFEFDIRSIPMLE